MSSQRGALTPERILHYIEAHYHEPITPRDVAAALHYSLCHLTHVTQRTLGASPGDLLLRRRIAKARRLLQETALPVARIAARVGFTDLAHFSRRYSQVMGVSPTQYRKVYGRAARHRCVCRGCGRALPFSPGDAA